MMSPKIREFINRGIMPLVGREREQRTLLDAFAMLLEGEPRAIWMTGIAGVGKSRLLDELKHHARDHAARALVVHAKWYEGEAVELGPLSNALEVLRPAIAAPLAARIYRDGAIATVDAAVEAVQIASRRYPVVMILDDLHYLSGSSELIRFVGALEEIPLLLVVTTRPVENPALRAFRSALVGSLPPMELELGSLDGAAIAEASVALFGQAPPAEMLGQLADLSGGLPLALREVFRELMAADHIAQSPNGDAWGWQTPFLPDEELRQIGDRVHGFSGRLASLPPHERAMLVLAASLGEQFNRELLRQLAERTVGWDDHDFERLILGGFIAVATPSIRIGAQETEGRVCYAFQHTLLWKAAAALNPPGLPSPGDIATATLSILTTGAGELYGVLPLEGAHVGGFGEEELRRLFHWLVAVGRKLSPIYAETYVALCRAVLEPCRIPEVASRAEQRMAEEYLAALSAYGERLYVTGAREPLQEVAAQIAGMLDRMKSNPPATAPERVVRLDAAVVVWRDAMLAGDPSRAKGFLDELLTVLPPPSQQTDRELRGAAEAIRLLASYSFARGEFAEMSAMTAPYIAELDRVRPETLNALMKVLLYAMMGARRMEEAWQMVEAGLRLRREADLFTEYELLLHAANYWQRVGQLQKVRQHATELRALVDRFPAYRNLSTNYFHLPYVAAANGEVEELERLETAFTATPPPARSSVVQTAIAQIKFLDAWSLLGMASRALATAGKLQLSLLSPLQQLQVTEKVVRAHIDAGNAPAASQAVQALNDLAEQVGGDYSTPNTISWQRLLTLRVLAEGIGQKEPERLRGMIMEMEAQQIEDGDAFRAAQIVLRAAEQVPERKREFNEAGYHAIELAAARAKTEQATGLAHYQLDRLSELLPKTRLAKFRQLIGPDPRSTAQQEEPERGSEAAPPAAGLVAGPILRTFGALRIEGAGETSAKIESKTRTMVAVLVTARMGGTRSIGELTRDRLADLLWPDMSLERAVNNLHVTLSYARRFLGGASTILQQDGVYLLGDDVLIDAVEFRECIVKGNRLYAEGVYFGAAVAYRRAIDFASADFLEGMYAEWIDTMRETLRGELATALERLIAIELDRENFVAVPALAERLLTLDDLHDGAYEALIRSAAARGARREAFSYFQRYEAALDTYGAGPTRRITELMNKVRAGDS
ncbi:MAG: AAA family ATPase [Candidatus Kapabacteria bacterium]|nr:AAA family ATPase [Candidatus Kapabacteria bacterium]